MGGKGGTGDSKAKRERAQIEMNGRGCVVLVGNEWQACRVVVL